MHLFLVYKYRSISEAKAFAHLNCYDQRKHVINFIETTLWNLQKQDTNESGGKFDQHDSVITWNVFLITTQWIPLLRIH